MRKINFLQNRQPAGANLIFTISLLLALNVFSPSAAVSATPQINLGSAGKLQILSGSVITLGGGIIGAEPEFDVVSTSAVADLQLAIASVATFSGTTGTADLGSMTYGPGVYLSPGGAAFAMTGDVILDGREELDPIFIFYTPAAMNTTAGVKVTLINGAQPKNIYWVVGGAITTGASSNLSGIFMSNAAITTGASNTFTGCLLGAGAVTVGAVNVFNPCPLTSLPPTCSISISAPEGYSLPESGPGHEITALIDSVTVTQDCANGGKARWSALVSMTDLVDGPINKIGKAAITYLAKDLLATTGITTQTASESSFEADILAVKTSELNGSNTASWSAQVKVLIPMGQAIGSYSGTLTHSVY